MMPQSNGGEVGKDHEDDSDSKATFSLGSNLINSFWFGVSATLVLFLSSIFFQFIILQLYLKDRNMAAEKL